jgi:hypothetical protein
LRLNRTFAAAILVLAAMPAGGHRLDEYLQGAILTVAKNRVEVEMTLTPGVAVYRGLIAQIDTNSDGGISEAEQHAYAESVLRDLLLTLDGSRLAPQLLSIRFPAMDEMKEGRGEIQLDFDAALPAGGRTRKLVFENHHQSGISVYQVNCLVPRDPHIRIASQDRNYSQSHYQLEFQQTDAGSGRPSLAWLGVFAILPLALLQLKRAKTSASGDRTAASA